MTVRVVRLLAAVGHNPCAWLTQENDKQSIDYRRTVFLRRKVLSVSRAFSEKGANVTFACANLTEWWGHIHRLGIHNYHLPKDTVVVALWAGERTKHPRYLMVCVLCVDRDVPPP